MKLLLITLFGAILIGCPAHTQDRAKVAAEATAYALELDACFQAAKIAWLNGAPASEVSSAHDLCAARADVKHGVIR